MWLPIIEVFKEAENKSESDIKMKKVKMISDTQEDWFEEEVEKFINSSMVSKIHNIEYSIASMDGYGDVLKHSALIIYE